ncbi:methylthioribulose 1-phosphate dehydratase [Streptomyces sp. NA04227]|uniref:methylthioribulose 1-phosphate dehydratase n=1 Tax=Streptomyces sp. NA04227 TaxID=2742136 RepID=UPI001591D79A|nr:methylthioribulose 1-phosphate dehydratase [Streptomyces sp. NA04227]QKW10435.1 methylthioribulose 1-phosphate dehydratase [Streptomyces sp. NA04227]
MSAVTDDETRDALGRQLALFSRVLYERGWMPGTAGNLSARLPDRAALITASGRDKGALTERDMVTVDADTGREVDDCRTVHPSAGRLRASAETSIHAAVYRSTDAGAVIHVHSPYATALASRTGDTARTVPLRIERYELLKGLGLADPSHTRLPVFPNWSEVPRIAEDVARHLAADPAAPAALLITDHGVTAWGRDLPQARNRLECVEALSRLILLAGSGAPANHPL